MNVEFPNLKVGSAFFRNGGLYEVLSLSTDDGDTIIVEDLINGGVVGLDLKTLRRSFSNRPGEMEIVPRDIARREAQAANRRRSKGTGFRGRQPLDMRKTGLYAFLLKVCQVRRVGRYQTSYTIRDGFKVITYRRTSRIDFLVEPGHKICFPWTGALPRGVIKYTKDSPYHNTRPFLSHYVCPRTVRDTALAAEYVQMIVTKTAKEGC